MEFKEANGRFFAKCVNCGAWVALDYHLTAHDMIRRELGEVDLMVACDRECAGSWIKSIPERDRIVCGLADEAVFWIGDEQLEVDLAENLVREMQ